MAQKFQRGDHVQIAKDLGPSMAHFRADCDAIVIGSYYEQYGGGEREKHIYTLFFQEGGSCSWYYESQLGLIEATRHDLLKQWQEELEYLNAKYSDLNWIFDPANREEMLNNPPHPAIRGLAACLLITEDDLWGPHGEGITYLGNAMRLREHVRPYLERSSKVDWLIYCEQLIAKAKS